MGTQKDSAGKTLALRPSFPDHPGRASDGSLPAPDNGHQHTGGTEQAEPVDELFARRSSTRASDGLGALPWFLAGMRGTFLSVAWLGGNKTSRGTAAGLDHRRHGNSR